jgi:FkbM family methyltransferase
MELKTPVNGNERYRDLGKDTGRDESEWRSRPHSYYKKSFPLSEVEFVRKSLIWEPGKEAQLSVILPNFVVDYVANWWRFWEAARFMDMKSKLRHGDILFDVGTETGWISAIYAQFVGGENICLFEPEPRNWPNIKATWRANELEKPLSTFCGLVGDKNTGKFCCDVWPKESNSTELIATAATAYRYIGDPNIPEITLDDFVRLTDIVPDALTIDVEGAEYLVLTGAKEILRKYHPIVWLSIHDRKDVVKYGGSPEKIHEFMHELGYTSSFMEEDHEAHWVYE